MCEFKDTMSESRLKSYITWDTWRLACSVWLTLSSKLEGCKLSCDVTAGKDNLYSAMKTN